MSLSRSQKQECLCEASPLWRSKVPILSPSGTSCHALPCPTECLQWSSGDSVHGRAGESKNARVHGCAREECRADGDVDVLLQSGHVPGLLDHSCLLWLSSWAR